MEKVIRLISILDERVVDRLILLDRLVTLYAKFTRLWTRAEVRSDGAKVRVKFFKINKYDYEQFTERVFPIDDIDKRIASYRRKLKKVFSERHENPRILRERDIHSWKKTIDDAKV